MYSLNTDKERTEDQGTAVDVDNWRCEGMERNEGSRDRWIRSRVSRGYKSYPCCLRMCPKFVEMRQPRARE